MAFETKTTTEILNQILIDILQNNDKITDVNVGSVLRTFSEAIALQISDGYTQIQNVFNGTRIDTATGDDLDQIAKLVGITRLTGTKSTGTLTFIRNTPATVDFTIASGLVVSTQPNTGEDTKRFVTTTSGTFFTSIADEAHLFADGINKYSMNERFIDSITSLDATVGGTSDTILTQGTDYQLTKNFNDFLVDASTVTVLDDMETTENWIASNDATTPLLTSEATVRGSFSLMLGKQTVLTNQATYSKTLSASFDGTDKDYIPSIWFRSTDVINKVNKITAIIGSGGSASIVSNLILITLYYKVVLTNTK